MFAIVSASAATGLDPDEAPLREALEVELGGGAVSVVHWHDPDVDWERFDAALIRSTWDYIDHLDEYLAWADEVEGFTSLLNPASVVRWNTDKRYLADLEAEGVPVVPTKFVAPGDPCPTSDATMVAKPSVGAGSKGARRCRPGELGAHVAALHGAGQTAMIQPYLADIDDSGETALCFIPGADGGLEFSHAFGKGAILAVDQPAQEGDLFAKEEISLRRPSSAEMALAETVLAAPCVRALGPLAYARVDVAPAATGPVVMELELVEPSLYFHVAPGSAARAARGFARLIGS